MNFDKDLKQAFERHAGDVSPTPGAWTGVERRIRRSHRLRTALATAGGAAAIVAAALVVPSILPDRDGDNTPVDSPSPTPTTASVPSDWNAFRNERDGYWLRLPKDWRIGEFEAHVQLTPPNVPQAQEDSPDFSVEFWLDQADYAQKAKEMDGPSGGEETTVAGRRARKGGVEGPYVSDGPQVPMRRSIRYLVDWTGYEPCGFNHDAVMACSGPPPTTLWVVISGTISGDNEQWSKHSGVADQIVGSLAMNYGTAMPTGLDVRTRRGAVAKSVTYDHHTAVLVRFMEARIEGGGAEEYLTANATRQFDTHEGGLLLYAPGGHFFLNYEIGEMAEADANSREYTVVMTVDKVDGGWQPNHETLGVGPADGKRALIRFAASSDQQPG